MKKSIIAIVAAAVTLCSTAPAFAYDHHTACHKVRVHHHCETRCH